VWFAVRDSTLRLRRLKHFRRAQLLDIWHRIALRMSQTHDSRATIPHHEHIVISIVYRKVVKRGNASRVYGWEATGATSGKGANGALGFLACLRGRMSRCCYIWIQRNGSLPRLGVDTLSSGRGSAHRRHAVPWVAADCESSCSPFGAHRVRVDQSELYFGNRWSIQDKVHAHSRFWRSRQRNRGEFAARTCLCELVQRKLPFGHHAVIDGETQDWLQFRRLGRVRQRVRNLLQGWFEQG
jgi:hypothetical protein